MNIVNACLGVANFSCCSDGFIMSKDGLMMGRAHEGKGCPMRVKNVDVGW